jgi:hypothetical protein
MGDKGIDGKKTFKKTTILITMPPEQYGAVHHLMECIR